MKYVKFILLLKSRPGRSKTVPTYIISVLQALTPPHPPPYNSLQNYLAVEDNLFQVGLHRKSSREWAVISVDFQVLKEENTKKPGSFQEEGNKGL